MEKPKTHRLSMNFPSRMIEVIDQVKGVDLSSSEEFIRRSVALRIFLDKRRQEAVQSGQPSVIRIGQQWLSPDLLLPLYASPDVQKIIDFPQSKFDELRIIAQRNIGRYIRESVALSVAVLNSCRDQNISDHPILSLIPIDIGDKKLAVLF